MLEGPSRAQLATKEIQTVKRNIPLFPALIALLIGCFLGREGRADE